MSLVISKNHLSLNDKLIKEANSLTQVFDAKTYSRIEDIDKLLLKRDISVKKKKQMLFQQLHELVLKAFSIDRKKFSKKAFELLKKRLHDIRGIISNARSINYYLETAFLEDLKNLKVKLPTGSMKIGGQVNLAKDELEALEYAAYRLVGKAVMLDKKLIVEYSSQRKKIIFKEKTEFNNLGIVLRKESSVLEHLEAKIPPPALAGNNLLKEPVFTHWVSRVFALLAYSEHLYSIEKKIFKTVRKNKEIKVKISQKIEDLVKEESKLLNVLAEKELSMKTFDLNSKIKEHVHKLTTTINL